MYYGKTLRERYVNGEQRDLSKTGRKGRLFENGYGVTASVYREERVQKGQGISVFNEGCKIKLRMHKDKK